MAIDADYVELHWGYELKVLLVAATTWQAWKARQHDRSTFPPFGIDIAQDSALVHTRSLWENFMRADRAKLRADLGVTAPFASVLYDTFGVTINRKVLHDYGQRDSVPRGDDDDTLLERVVELAHDVLRLWGELRAEASADAQAALDAARARAIADASEAAAYHGITRVFA